ncbi:MAG: hypothetical protein MJ105_02205 [Lachnospiraceae bacterium]|nr:hypothetical protein [Lachnospiraceae bacterium]
MEFLALILAIASIPLTFFLGSASVDGVFGTTGIIMAIIPVVVGILGIVMAAVSKKKGKGGVATAALVVAIIGTVFATIRFAACVACHAAANKAGQEITGALEDAGASFDWEE